MYQNFDFGDPKYRATSPNFTPKARGKQSLAIQNIFDSHKFLFGGDHE